MTLNSTGQISLGGPTTGQSVNLELGKAATDVVTTNDTDVRTLAGEPALLSPVVMPVDFWGKSFIATGSYLSKVLSISGTISATGGSVDVMGSGGPAYNSYVLTNGPQVQRYDTTGAVKAQKYYIGTTNGYAETFEVYPNSTYLPKRLARDPSGTGLNFYFIGIATVPTLGTQYIKVLKIDSTVLLPAWAGTGTKALAFTPTDIAGIPSIAGLTNPALNNNGDVICAFTTTYPSEPPEYRLNILSLKNISSAGVVGTLALRKIYSSTTYLYPQVITRINPATSVDFECIIGGYRTTDDYGYIPFVMRVNADGTVFNTFNIINTPITVPSNPLSNYYANGASIYCIKVSGGYVYVCMEIQGTLDPQNYGAYLVKMPLALNSITWARKIDGASYVNGSPPFRSIAFDTSGNIYAAGSCIYSGNQVCCIFKYNSSGTLQWARYITRTDIPYQAIIYDIQIETAGSVMVIATNLLDNTSTFRFPIDGSKTGSYTVTAVPVVYGVLPITPTDATSELTTIYLYTSSANTPVTEVASTVIAYDTDYVSSVTNI